MPIDHWMNFGTFAEQKYFTYPTPNTYKGVIINGNMASHAPDGLAAFILEKTKSLPYIIDPLTHAFQHNFSAIENQKGGIKKSIEKMVSSYGDIIQSAVDERRPLNSKNFESDTKSREFVERTLDFQDSILQEPMSDSDTLKYLDFNDHLEPYAVIAPYFYMNETSIDNWLPVNINLCEIAIKYKESQKLMASIVIDQAILDDIEKINQIVNYYTKLDIKGFLIWIDDFDETSTSISRLRNFLKLIKGLRDSGNYEIINLHGGYFSILASGSVGNHLFDGVAHGPEYGEFRSVIPVGGGIPVAKFYIPRIHSRVKYREALQYLQYLKYLENANIYFKNVCNCALCQEVIDNNSNNFQLFGEATAKEVRRGSSFVRIDYPTTETKERCLKHYLQRKEIEYYRASNETKDVLLEELEATYNEYFNAASEENISHLLKWKQVLSEL